MRHETFSDIGYGRSRQIRADLPEGVDIPHPRMQAMAETMRDLRAVGGGVSYRDLARAGYTSAEIIEFHEAASRLADERWDKQVSVSPDLLADLVMKAREAFANSRPMPKGTVEAQALFVAWGAYCAARAALQLDPWDGQRERCMGLLTAYFRQTTAGEAVIGYVVAQVADAMYGRSGARLQ